MDAFLELDGLEALAGIPPGLLELGQDIAHGLHAETLVHEELGIKPVQHGLIAQELRDRSDTETEVPELTVWVHTGVFL